MCCRASIFIFGGGGRSAPSSLPSNFRVFKKIPAAVPSVAILWACSWNNPYYSIVSPSRPVLNGWQPAGGERFRRGVMDRLALLTNHIILNKISTNYILDGGVLALLTN